MKKLRANSFDPGGGQYTGEPGVYTHQGLNASCTKWITAHARAAVNNQNAQPLPMTDMKHF